MTADKILLYNALLPLLVSAVIVFLAWRRHSPGPVWSSVATGLALALAYGSMHAPLSGGWPPFPATEASGWLPYQVMLAAACGVAVSAARRRPAIMAAIRLLASALCSWLVLRPLLTQWTAAEAAAQVFAPAALSFLCWSLHDGLRCACADRPCRMRSSWLAILSSLTFLNSSFASLAQLTGAFAAAVGGTCVVALLRRDFSLSGAGVAMISVFLVCAGANAHAFASLTRTNALLLIGALLAPGILWLPPLATAGRWRQCAIAASAALVPAGIALALALAQAPRGGF
ncbi:MAG: hypothetical protein U1E76_14105 [Planctomycetota bacterium]